MALTEIINWLLSISKNPLIMKTAVAGIIVISGIIAARYFSKGIGIILNKIGVREKFRERGLPNPEHFLENAIKYIIIAIAFIAALNRLGIVKAVLAVAVLVVASIVAIIFFLLFRDIINNFVSGILLQSRRAINVNQKIEITDIKGVVQEFNILETKIKNNKGEIIILPNSFVLKNIKRAGIRKA